MPRAHTHTGYVRPRLSRCDDPTPAEELFLAHWFEVRPFGIEIDSGPPWHNHTLWRGWLELPHGGYMPSVGGDYCPFLGPRSAYRLRRKYGEVVLCPQALVYQFVESFPFNIVRFEQRGVISC